MPLTQEQKEWAARAALNAGYLFKEMLAAVDAPAPAVEPGEEMFEIKHLEPNPAVRLFGKGLEGVPCKHCVHLIRKTGYSKTYFKCAWRGDTNGPATDHRVGWQSCKKYELEETCHSK